MQGRKSNSEFCVRSNAAGVIRRFFFPNVKCQRIESLAAGLEQMMSSRIELSMTGIKAFCERHGVAEFSLFGSVLRSDFGPHSDVDLM